MFLISGIRLWILYPKSENETSLKQNGWNVVKTKWVYPMSTMCPRGEEKQFQKNTITVVVIPMLWHSEERPNGTVGHYVLFA